MPEVDPPLAENCQWCGSQPAPTRPTVPVGNGRGLRRAGAAFPDFRPPSPLGFGRASGGTSSPRHGGAKAIRTNSRILRQFASFAMKKITYIFLLAFLLNWVWENLHAALYFHPNGEPMTQSMLLLAALLDAILITLVGVLFLRVKYLRQRIWSAFLFGMAMAVIIEIIALHTGIWAYKALMPLIPIIHTGLTPTIQLGLLAYVVFKIVFKTDKIA